uniref:Uncharacterized protein n=2 Tax=Spongospora subterranea TaxID=70186 RepID=A0A0H5RCG0_9EUKA|eukprot:CRZ11718.1 hypothetical protein [Spongospora subterranea]
MNHGVVSIVGSVLFYMNLFILASLIVVSSVIIIYRNNNEHINGVHASKMTRKIDEEIFKVAVQEQYREGDEEMITYNKESALYEAMDMLTCYTRLNPRWDSEYHSIFFKRVQVWNSIAGPKFDADISLSPLPVLVNDIGQLFTCTLFDSDE